MGSPRVAKNVTFESLLVPGVGPRRFVCDAAGIGGAKGCQKMSTENWMQKVVQKGHASKKFLGVLGP